MISERITAGTVMRYLGQKEPAYQASACRVLPFAVFMAFITVEEGMRLVARQGLFTLQPQFLHYLYPVKTMTVAVLMYLFRERYSEVQWRELRQGALFASSCAVGIGTCVMWVFCDWTLPTLAPSNGFNPTLLPPGIVRVAVTTVRVTGAVLVVPLMEELFWRSFLLRYLIRQDFRSVPLGQFTWGSCIVTALLFGLEHQLFFAGVIAGVVYSLILYKTRSLAHCILAHAVTNLSLACYVLYTGKWYFW